MPQRRSAMTRQSLQRDIEAIRPIIRQGLPWNKETWKDRSIVNLTVEQRALLGNVSPFRSAARFLVEFDPPREMKAEITREGKPVPPL
jgi:hypothetical protein